METWYYWADNQEFGPVTKLELYKLFKTNVIAGYSFVRPQNSDAWLSYKELKIRRSDFTWEELNEKKLNNTIPVVTTSENISDANTDDVWNDFSPHPWRRSFARWIDISIYANLIFSPAITGFSPDDLNDLMQHPTIAELLVILIIIPMLFLGFVAFLNAISTGILGTTIGKYLLGVKVLTKDHLPLSMKHATKRETLVFIKGFALGLPVLSLITQMYGYFDLTMDKATSWDKSMDTVIVHRENNGLQLVICIIAIGLYLYSALSPYPYHIAWF
ncbi:RDD family protein [Kiloniella majae]|uniref:RDD family protein n=1 Tax=Kiloniella majae TaxID=1938558 RepID=UPI000A27971E|nr:RDD family protein [Kiloniella majae]